MILFRPEFVEPILSGKKTQTRRKNIRRMIRVGAIHSARVDVDAEPFASLKIISTRTERLGDISEDDAKKEGFDSIAAFRDFWWDIYEDFDADAWVCVIDFEVVKGVEKC